MPSIKTNRYRAVAACATASLGCGTIYVYSAYSVQLADRLHFSAVQSSTLGMMGTLGMSLLGIPGGILIDKYGITRPSSIGSILILLGYSSLYFCYANTIDHLLLVCLAYATAAFGSSIVFTSCIKTAALNFKKSRGTATSIPLAAFGLCALFFSAIASIFFPGNTQYFLGCLAILTFLLTACSIPFLKIYTKSKPSDSVDPTTLAGPERSSLLSASEPRVDSSSVTPAQISTVSSVSNLSDLTQNDYLTAENAPLFEEGAFYHPDARDLRNEQATLQDTDIHDHRNITGWSLMKDAHFWKLCALCGFASGPGQMYIYSVGYCIRAVTRVSHPDMTPHQVQTLQALQVALISLTNCFGRLTSGFLSDRLVRRHGLQRMWLMVASLLVALIGHATASRLQQPMHFWIISVLIGYSYGLIFGVYPTIVSESFGLKHFSQNWGWVGCSPVITSYLYNLIFGKIYDSNSDSEHVCTLGIACYSRAFVITTCTSLASLILALALIYEKRHEKHILYKPTSST